MQRYIGWLMAVLFAGPAYAQCVANTIVVSNGEACVGGPVSTTIQSEGDRRRLIVFVAGEDNEAGDPANTAAGDCNLEGALVMFGAAELRYAATAREYSDRNCTGVYDLDAEEIDNACGETYPCTLDVTVDMGPEVEVDQLCTIAVLTTNVSDDMVLAHDMGKACPTSATGSCDGSTIGPFTTGRSDGEISVGVTVVGNPGDLTPIDGGPLLYSNSSQGGTMSVAVATRTVGLDERLNLYYNHPDVNRSASSMISYARDCGSTPSTTVGVEQLIDEACKGGRRKCPPTASDAFRVLKKSVGPRQ